MPSAYVPTCGSCTTAAAKPSAPTGDPRPVDRHAVSTRSPTVTVSSAIDQVLSRSPTRYGTAGETAARRRPDRGVGACGLRATQSSQLAAAGVLGSGL